MKDRFLWDVVVREGVAYETSTTKQRLAEMMGQKEVCISVTDQGIGIDRSELPHIFNPFYRSPRVNSAQIHGTGLGLSLAKNIADAIGGKLFVVSELGAGSTFILHLQVALNEDKQAEALVSESLNTSHNE